MTIVRPSRRIPPDSWMWPCNPSSGCTWSSASRTAVEPTGANLTWPMEAWTVRFGIEHRGLVEADAVGRDVDVEDRAFRRLELGGHVADRRGQLLPRSSRDGCATG